MTDHPIIFSAPMVQALLREADAPGTGKTMTRRLAWRLKDVGDNHTRVPTPWQRVKPGERLWVRENLTQRPGKNLLTGEPMNFLEAAYATDDEDVVNEHGFNLLPWWKGEGGLPSIHMPRYVSRLTLVVTATKIERLQEISDDDAKVEGLEWRDGAWGVWNADGSMRCGGSIDIREAFRCLWTNIHGAGAWEANPEVVALTFTVHLRNIDQMQEAA